MLANTSGEGVTISWSKAGLTSQTHSECDGCDGWEGLLLLAKKTH